MWPPNPSRKRFATTLDEICVIRAAVEPLMSGLVLQWSCAFASDMALTGAHRHFAERGFAVIPAVVPPRIIDSLKRDIASACEARKACFTHIPKTVDMFRQQFSTRDPAFSDFHAKYNAYRERKRAERRRRLALKQDIAKATAELGDMKDDVRAVAQKVAEMMLSRPASAVDISSDPQRLSAIKRTKCNAWMTHEGLRQTVHSVDFGVNVLGRLASEVAGVIKPRLFCDRPHLRGPFDRPTALHFAAPFIGADLRHSAESYACNVWIVCDGTDRLRCPLVVLPNSHRVVSAHYDQPRSATPVPPSALKLDVTAVDSDTALWLRRFPALAGDEKMSAEFLPPLPPGSAVVLHPLLFVAMGCHLTDSNHVSAQFLCVGEDAKPSIHTPSWVRHWKASSQEVRFTADVVFPKLWR